MIRKVRYKYTPICDGCGVELEPSYDYFDATKNMKVNGWSFSRANKMSSEWFNFCPTCTDKRKRKNDPSLTKE